MRIANEDKLCTSSMWDSVSAAIIGLTLIVWSFCFGLVGVRCLFFALFPPLAYFPNGTITSWWDLLFAATKVLY